MTEPANDVKTVKSAYAGVPVMVLGATGFIGRWVARLLSSAGAELTCPVRDENAARSIFAEYGVTATLVNVDLLNSRALEQVYSSCQPFVTFNLAGYGVDRTETDAVLSKRINTQLVVELADLAKQHSSSSWPGIRFVHTGSALEYGSIGGHLPESADPRPTTVYGLSKLAGTRLLMARHPIGAVTARLFTVYGAGEHEGRLLPSLLAGAGKPRISLSAGLQRRDFTYVEDVAEGLLRLARAPSVPGGVVNLATGKLYSVREFAETAAKVLHIPEGRLDFGALPTRPDEMPHDDVSVERLRQSIAWVPASSVAEGVSRTASFLARVTKQPSANIAPGVNH